MSTDLETRFEGPITVDDDDDYHHHAKGDVSFEDLRGELVAWCGVRRPPKRNPLEHPCCPECARLMNKPCVSKGWS